MDLISVDEARSRLMALFAPLGGETVALGRAAGRVLAADMVATRDLPPFEASAMDGYAVRGVDARPGVRLAIVGTSAAGAGFRGTLGPDEAVRIFTGAPMPDGADWVVIQEEAARTGDWLEVTAPQDGRPAIRPRGDDFREGFRLAAPRRLGAADIALLAAMNAGEVPVARRPVIALIPTGDELVAVGGTPGRDQIVSSNDQGLKVLLEAAGAEVRLLPIARDHRDSLSAVLALADGADLVVTIGGASVGDLDLVRGTAKAEGIELAFHRIAMRPGKPLLAGRIRGVPFVGLPGNPVSALVCAHVFLRPAITCMLGLPDARDTVFRARLATAVAGNGPRTHFLRARVEADAEGWCCTPFERQDSALLSVLAEANALMIRPPDDPARVTGEDVAFTFL